MEHGNAGNEVCARITADRMESLHGQSDRFEDCGHCPQAHTCLGEDGAFCSRIVHYAQGRVRFSPPTSVLGGSAEHAGLTMPHLTQIREADQPSRMPASAPSAPRCFGEISFCMCFDSKAPGIDEGRVTRPLARLPRRCRHTGCAFARHRDRSACSRVPHLM